MNSVSKRFPIGLGNDNGLLGKFVAFHNYNTKISAEFDGLPEFATFGGRPGSTYIPRFRNMFRQETDFLRGYATGFSARRNTFSNRSGIGADLKESLLNPKLGGWRVGAHMMGETIPKKATP